METMLQKRPPVVVVLGSVDHGKTTLLDYIRKTNVAAKEAGGITQSTGAYEISHNGQKITFIDTPGHEAFFKMRSRGAKIADVAILVVAADDGVKPQTKEAIKITQESETPYIVAINKIDKNPNLDKVKNDLMQAGVLLEGYGGNVSYQPISAKTGEGVNELLDLILLTADVEDLKYDPDQKAEGFIVESKLDSRRGIIAAAIIKNGTLKIGDEIAAGAVSGKIKSLETFFGEKIKQAEASSPVLITGFNSLPKIGEEFFVGKLAHSAGSGQALSAGSGQAEKIETPAAKTGAKINAAPDKESLNLIIKGDVSGSVEALSEIIKTLPAKAHSANSGQEKPIKIISESVGDISDGDVKLAISTDASIIGFKVKATKVAENLAQEHRIEIISSDIIYELLKLLEEKIVSSKQKIAGKLEILAIFSHRQGETGKKDKKQTIGGRVIEGEIKKNDFLQIERQGEKIGGAKVWNLQQNKKDVTRTEAGKECGLLVDSPVEIKIGDILISQ